MTGNELTPPKMAVSLLRLVFRGRDSEPLAGDLIEAFREGRSRRWFWRQVLTAVVINVLKRFRRHWPEACYGLTGAMLPSLFGRMIPALWAAVPWWTLPFPLSMLAFDLMAPVLHVLAGLPVLAVALWIHGALRWSDVVRTGVVSILAIALHFYVLAFLQFYFVPPHPAPTRSTPPVIAAAAIALHFFLLFAAAWFGCRGARRAARTLTPA